MPKNFDEIEFTILDTETTGLEPGSGDRIVEIAGIRLKGKEKISVFQSLVDPERPISEAAFRVNKISREMLRGAPKIREVMPEFLKFSQGSCLCSYNATFDLGFLNNELRLMGQPPLQGIVFIDILKMSRRLVPGLERYALWFVAQNLGIKTLQEHRALSDVELTLGVFNRLVDSLKAKGVLDFDTFCGLFGIDPVFLEGLNNQRIAEIQQAIDLGVKLDISYLSGSNAEVSRRQVIPKEIRQDRNSSYLVGFCCLRNEERTFRIDGILHLEIV